VSEWRFVERGNVKHI